MTIDQAIAEFEQAVKVLFDPHKREIDRLKERIAKTRRRHGNAAVLQKELVELMAAEIRRELAA